MEPFTSNETFGSYKKSLYSPGDDPIAFFHVTVGLGYLKNYLLLLLLLLTTALISKKAHLIVRSKAFDNFTLETKLGKKFI